MQRNHSLDLDEQSLKKSPKTLKKLEDSNAFDRNKDESPNKLRASLTDLVVAVLEDEYSVEFAGGVAAAERRLEPVHGRRVVVVDARPSAPRQAQHLRFQHENLKVIAMVTRHLDEQLVFFFSKRTHIIQAQVIIQKLFRK